MLSGTRHKRRSHEPGVRRECRPSAESRAPLPAEHRIKIHLFARSPPSHQPSDSSLALALTTLAAVCVRARPLRGATREHGLVGPLSWCVSVPAVTCSRPPLLCTAALDCGAQPASAFHQSCPPRTPRLLIWVACRPPPKFKYENMPKNVT